MEVYCKEKERRVQQKPLVAEHEKKKAEKSLKKKQKIDVESQM